jgi:hypothetical protein
VMKPISSGFFVSDMPSIQLMKCELTEYSDHLRYIFDSCLFDHLDGQGETLGSCMEDSPCDGLDVVLKSGTNDPTSKSPDGYCAVDGSTDLSHSVETCLRCVQSSGSHKYLSNCKFVPVLARPAAILVPWLTQICK